MNVTICYLSIMSRQIAPPKSSTPLDKYLSDQGLTDAEFAKRIQCSREYVSMLRKGARRPSLEIADRIARATVGNVPLTSWVTATARAPRSEARA